MGDLKPVFKPAAAESIVAKRGTTTTNGAVDGSTVVDTGLTEANDYWNDMTLLILNGACDGQSRDITGFAGGTLTVSPVFASRILSGVRYFILPFKPSAAEVEDLKGTGFVKDTDSLVNVSHIAGAKGTDNISDHLGYEGATSLADKLTAARAGFLDNIDNANLATIADISSLTATEIGYLANIDNANLATIPDISTLSAARIGYLDNINNANLATIPAISAARIGYLDNIDNANLATIADISSLTATEIGYLANIDNANLATIPDISTLSVARIGYLDNINNANLATIPAISAARIGYLDNINNANLATIADISSLTATEIGYLANIDNANLATIADISSLTATEIGYLAELAAANLPADIDALKLGLDNLTGDMSAVAQSEAGSLSAFNKRHVDHSRGHNQTRIGFIIPDLSNIGTDAANAAIKTQLDLIGSCNYIDQTGVDGGDNNWLEYNLLVVGSDANYAFNTANLDDLITMKIPIIVVSSGVAIHLKMGHDAVADTGSVTNIYVETIDDRVMALVFGALADQTIFSAGAVSSRLDMSDAQLTEHLLATVGGGGGGTNAETVIGDLPFSDGAGTIFTLDEGTELPAGRTFAGCFLHAESLDSTGQDFFRRLCRNIVQSVTTPSLEIKASAAKVNAILADVTGINGDAMRGTDSATLAATWTDARAGYLDNIDNANLATISDISTLTATEIGYLANINNANLATIADISTLTATEIAHLDADISAVVQQVALTGHPADSIGKILYDFYNTRLTATICGYLNNANLGTIADISTLTATEIARLDADISSRAPASEYDTEMARITANVATEAKQDIIDGIVDNILTETQSHPTLAEIEASAVLALKAHLVHGTGDIIPPDNKGIWDYLPFLDAAISGRAPANEYDTQLDANISTRAPSGEYDTQMGYITEAVATDAKQDIIDGIVDAIKAKTDLLPAANVGVSGSITWVTLTHTTNEGDISALFSTDLTGATRRRYAVYVDLTGAEADGAAWTKCTVRVKIGFGAADAYRTVDLKEIAKTDVAATSEPGIPIDVPATAKNVQITLQFDVALAGDATIYYSYVKEALE